MNHGTPYVEILPAPSSSSAGEPKKRSVVPVSDEESSLDSLDMKALDDYESDLGLLDGNPFCFLEHEDLDALQAVVSSSSSPMDGDINTIRHSFVAI